MIRVVGLNSGPELAGKYLPNFIQLCTNKLTELMGKKGKSDHTYRNKNIYLYYN